MPRSRQSALDSPGLLVLALAVVAYLLNRRYLRRASTEPFRLRVDRTGTGLDVSQWDGSCEKRVLP